VIVVRRTLLAGLATCAVTAGVWCVPTASFAATSTVVKCGQVVTTSIRVANNLADCPGNGLVVGAAHITIDLSGHSITGRNKRGSEGIADDGHAGVTIQNGTIARFFSHGVGLRKSPNSTVKNLTIRAIGAGGVEPDTSAGVLVQDSPFTSVVGSTVVNDIKAFQSDGVDVLSSKGSTMQGNTLVRNSWDGMVVLFSPDTHVIGNTFQANKNQGLELNGESDRSVVSGNFAGRNASNGLTVGDVSGVRIENNFLQGNPESGLFMFDLHGATISRNHAGGNGAGIDLEGGQNGSTNNVLSNNQTNRNTFVGLVVENNANQNVLTANTADANQGAPGQGGGIIIASANGNTLRNNVAVNNLDVGIGVFPGDPGDTKRNVLTGNYAVNNHAHGIDAVAGSIDGGGNQAHNNTPLPNCVGVVCK
jgi:parallel beta-helix repeat protein